MTKMKIATFFAGAGGLDRGFEDAGSLGQLKEVIYISWKVDIK